MTDYDLEKVYLFIDGAGGVAPQAVGPNFWTEIAANPAAGATMISASEGRADWTRWEMHPNGAEVLIILEGAPVIWLEHPEGQLEAVAARTGATIIVPKGVWHRAQSRSPFKILYVTYGAGTTHRPVSDEDRMRAEAIRPSA